MGRSFRLLPLTMLMAFMLLGIKVGQIMHDGQRVILSFTEAHAESEAAKEAPKDAAKPADDAKKDDPKVTPPSTQGDDETEAPKHEFSQVEIDLLQSLAKRRQDLDDWAKQVQLKENMLVATEQRINGKIDALQKVKKQVEDLLAQYNEQEETKIKSLVKIYENMKPKDAARIFEELDMPVLLEVVDRMKEKSVAPVLAAMSPTKAKDITVQLAEQRKLQKAKGTPALPPDTAPPADAPVADTASAPPASPAPPASAPATGTPAAGSAPAAGTPAPTASPAATPAATSPAPTATPPAAR